MTRQLPPLDLHAHVDPQISVTELEQLGAVVFAVTNNLIQYTMVKDRQDLMTVWGIGCHPSDDLAQNTYDSDTFASMLQTTAFVGEIGMDMRSKAPVEQQEAVFTSILDHLQDTPKITSIHSAGLPERVLDVLEQRPIKGAVLHWWRGNRQQTSRAIELGCWFSVNSAGMKFPDQIAQLPLSKILTETDHPFGDRGSSHPHQPGAVTDVEIMLARIHDMSPELIRRQIWGNLSRLTQEVKVENLLPMPAQRMLVYARQLD